MDGFQDLMAAYNISDITGVNKNQRKNTADNNNISNFNIKREAVDKTMPCDDTAECNILKKGNAFGNNVKLNIPCLYGQGDQGEAMQDIVPTNSLEKLEQLVRAEPQKQKRKRSRPTQKNNNGLPSAILKVPQYTGRHITSGHQANHAIEQQQSFPVGPHHDIRLPHFTPNNILPGHLNIPRNPFRPSGFGNNFPSFDRFPHMHPHRHQPPNECFQTYQIPIHRSRVPMTMMPPVPQFSSGSPFQGYFGRAEMIPPGVRGSNFMNNGMILRPHSGNVMVNHHMLMNNMGFPVRPSIDLFDGARNASPVLTNVRLPMDNHSDVVLVPNMPPDIASPTRNSTPGSSSTPPISTTPSCAKDTLNVKNTPDAIVGRKKPKTSIKKKKLDISYVSDCITEVTLLGRENPLPKYTPAVLVDYEEYIPGPAHECKSCGDTFLFKSSLDDHTNRRSLKISYFCSVCAQYFTFFNKCAHICHVEKHTKAEVIPKYENLQVGLLPLAEGEKDLLESQKTTETSNESMKILEDEIICPECQIKFNTPEEMMKHFQGEGVLKIEDVCTSCQLPLPSNCSLKAHSRIHLKIQPQVCPECGLTIISKEGFADHIKLKCHHLSRTVRYTCDCCVFIFEEQSTAAKHMRSVHADGYYKCHRCPMAFKSIESFNTHFASSHGNMSPPNAEHTWIVKCPMCNTVFRKANILGSHVAKHYEDEMKYCTYRFQCPHCATLEPTRKDLMKHLAKVHKCFYTRCDKCNVNCSSELELLSHQKNCDGLNCRRTTEKTPNPSVENISKSNEPVKSPAAPYECPVCKNRYFYRDSLYKHRRTHEKNGQFICLLCSAIFSDKVSQTEHSKLCLKAKSSQQLSKLDIHFCLSCNDTFLSLEDKKQHVCDLSKSDTTNHLTSNVKTPEIYSDITPVIVSYNEKEIELEKNRVEKELNDLFGVGYENASPPTPEKYPCLTCGMEFNCKDAMQKHTDTSHTSSLFKYVCYICRDCQVYKAFHRRDYLEKHIVNFHKLPRSKIDYARFPEEPKTANDNVANNSMSVHPAAKAQKLSLVLETDSSKRRKITGSDGEGEDTDDDDESEIELYKCASCSFTTDNKGEYEDHVAEHKAEEESIDCPECGMGFVVERTLQNHMLIVHKVRDYDKYSRRRRAKKQFSDHIRIPDNHVNCNENGFHSDSSFGHELECRKCRREFDTEIGLKKHIEKSHPNWQRSSSRQASRW